MNNVLKEAILNSIPWQASRGSHWLKLHKALVVKKVKGLNKSNPTKKEKACPSQHGKSFCFFTGGNKS